MVVLDGLSSTQSSSYSHSLLQIHPIVLLQSFERSFRNLQTRSCGKLFFHFEILFIQVSVHPLLQHIPFKILQDRIR